VVRLIRRKGWKAAFEGRTYRYVDVDGLTYWAMAFVVNRKPAERVEGPGLDRSLSSRPT
jgi:hypothetical protein